MIGFVEAISRAMTLEEAWDFHCAAMAEFGFDRLIYGHTRFVTEGSLGEFEDAVFLSNHDSGYFDRFITDRMFLHAPVTRWAQDNVGACSWGAIWADPKALTEEERRVVAFNRAMNVNAGYSISFADASPRSFALISLAASARLNQDDVEAIWARSGREIEAMNNVAHLKFISLPHKTMRARLSARQREVLEWVGEGKSNLDIATILGVSVPTIEKHLRLAREKLGVDTTAQAILKASFQNQIYVL